MNLIKIENTLTMTTLAIAELTGKEHRNILADTRKMLEELHGEEGLLSFQQSYLNEQNKSQPMFALPKRETLILVSGYNLAMRAKIIDRWQELEMKVAKPLSQTELIIAAAQQLRQVELEMQKVQERLTATETKHLEFDSKFDKIEEKVNSNTLLKSCPANAESISAIRARINSELGLSATVVDAVMRSLPYSPKPAGMVQNQKPEARGNSYAIWWTKDVTAIFRQFVKESYELGNGYFKHDFVEQRFKLK